MISKIITELSEKIRINGLLDAICAKLHQDFGLIPCIGVEIEFYLPGDNIINSPFPIKKEKGACQYEVDISPLNDPSIVAETIISTKKELAQWQAEINLHPKPFPNDYGSAMHFHINLLSDSANYYDDAKHLEAGAKALCHYLKQTFLIFAPDASHYTRFDGKMMAPTKVAYGGNNRSVAIRIPDAKPYRLEHRVSSPMTDPHLALFTILQSLYLGLKNPATIGDYTKIYGNAFDEQYDLEPLPQNLAEAMDAFNEEFFAQERL